MVRQLLLALLLAPGVASSGLPVVYAPVADFGFDDGFTDSQGNAADLIPLAPDLGGFLDLDINGEPRPAWVFSPGGGFSLALDGLVPSDTYSVAILLVMDDTDAYGKILDTSARASDTGLYAQGQDLRLYNTIPASNLGRFGADAWHQIVVTREASGLYTGYIDGRQEFSGDDGGVGVVSVEGLLHFFADDLVTEGEQTGGAVARIRLYDTALPASLVQALDDNQLGIFRNGFETPLM